VNAREETPRRINITLKQERRERLNVKTGGQFAGEQDGAGIRTEH
jgi:hypothetical protein